MEDIDLFPCYSWNLVKFLNNEGFVYKLVGLHPDTHKTFWVFIRTIELNKALDKWRETK